MRPSRVGWMPVSSATKIGGRARLDDTGVTAILSASWSERTALPTNATDRISRIVALAISIGFSGRRRPTFRTR